MAQAYPVRRSFTPEEYLYHERNARQKSEYLCGEIYAMAGGSPDHNLITMNVGGELRARLRASPCRVYSSDLKVRTTPDGLFAYPDVTVGCGEPVYHDEKADVLTNPAVLVEVLSPTTANYDRTTKLDMYLQIPALQECLLISQGEARVEQVTRQSENQWLRTITVGLDATLHLPSLGITLPLSEIYDKVTLPFPQHEV